MTTPFEYAETHAARFVEQLKEVLRIPSISTLSEHNDDVRRAAEWFRDQCAAIGMTRAELLETDGHPIVYAEWLGAGPDKPTVLVYGHYDVQPVDDPRKEWVSAPFDPVERDGNLYARGATDDKGQTFIHLKVFEAYMQTQGAFPVNVKFMFEGEEESGSRSLKPFMEKHQDLLACDMVVISDTNILAEDKPMIWYGLRGLVYVELEVTGPKGDLHSGSYGGAVHNPAQAVAEIVAKLHDEQGRVTVPGFYDDVVDISADERAELNADPSQEASFMHEAGVPQAYGDPAYTIIERLGARPTLEINGIFGGWTGEGAKTVIGKNAKAKISCRLVPNQDPAKIQQAIIDYVAQITPPTVQSTVTPLAEGAPGVLMSRDSEPMQTALAAYEKVFGQRPVFGRGGGSIPVVMYYQQMLDVPILLLGFGLPDDNLHAPNEKLTLKMFHKGVQTMLHFYGMLGEVS